MNASLISVFKLVLVWILQQAVMPKTTHEFCAEQVGDGFNYSTNPRVENYFRMCRHVDLYVQCILLHRVDGPDVTDHVVPLYEKYFPSGKDLQASVYTFCLQDLIQIRKLFDGLDMSCEKQIDSYPCYNLGDQNVYEKLDKAIKEDTDDLKVIRAFSCGLVVPITNCIEDRYLACNDDYIILKNFEIGKLGRRCLATHNIQSPFWTYKKCISDAFSFHNARNNLLAPTHKTPPQLASFCLTYAVKSCVARVYVFHIHILGYLSNVASVYLYQNDDIIVSAYGYVPASWGTGSNAVILELEAKDTAHVKSRMTTSSLHGGPLARFATFSGYLI